MDSDKRNQLRLIKVPHLLEFILKMTHLPLVEMQRIKQKDYSRTSCSLIVQNICSSYVIPSVAPQRELIESVKDKNMGSTWCTNLNMLQIFSLINKWRILWDIRYLKSKTEWIMCGLELCHVLYQWPSKKKHLLLHCVTQNAVCCCSVVSAEALMEWQSHVGMLSATLNCLSRKTAVELFCEGRTV